MSDLVVIERHALPGSDAVLGIVRLDDPDRLNPLSRPMFRAVHDALRELESDESVSAVGLTGTGRAFSAGGDMSAYPTLQRDPVQFPRFLDEAQRLFDYPAQMSKPVVALVNGIAAAGGLELVLACDFAYAARSARLGDAHQNFAQMGGGGVLTLLPRFVGLQRARELVFSGRFLPAEEALAWGLIARVVDDDQLLATMVEFAAGIASRSPLALANAKQVMTRGYLDGTGVATALRSEREATMRYCLTSEDAPEGLRAFAERRPGAYTGR